jgi:hypothetical protein
MYENSKYDIPKCLAHFLAFEIEKVTAPIMSIPKETPITIINFFILKLLS